MKHYHYFKRYAIIILPIIALVVTLVACKKDRLTDPQNNIESRDELSVKSTEQVIRQIKDFDKQIRQIKTGISRGERSVDVDSALWNIESLFNASFSFPDRNYIEKRKQELTYTIKVHNGRYVMMRDLSDLYDDIISTVREAYRNDGIDENKSLMSIIVKRGELVSNELRVKVVVISGRTAQQQFNIEAELWGPFKDDECWYYGEYGGSCDDPSIVSDAAKVLESVINFSYGNDQDESTASRNLYVDMTNISLTGNEHWNEKTNDYYIFYKVNCKESALYLDADDLNMYYHNLVDLIFKVVPNDVKYSSVLSKESKFMEINMEGMFTLEGKNKIYNHSTDILYGSKHVVKNTQLALPKDLLK